MATTTPRPLPIPTSITSNISSPGRRATVDQYAASPSPKPKNRPYVLKTLSPGALKRSNSTHSYVPTSPTPNSRHRYTQSDIISGRPAGSPTPSESPRPLPIPPFLESPSRSHRELHGYASSDDLRYLTGLRRADTFPTPPPPSPIKLEDLPSNPKIWSTAQLASYLITALRVTSGDSWPVPMAVAKDIAGFVKEARLTGRSFLRLNEQDLERMGVNNLWCEALLNASRSLRQNVVKGRIWGFEGDDHDRSDVFTSPYKNTFYSSSSSSVDDILYSPEFTPSKRNGKVRGMVASFERTPSSGSGSGFSSRGSSTSEGDVFGPAEVWADDEAAFASGSEASEAEDGHVRADTILKDHRHISQEPATPPVELLQEIPGEGETANHAALPEPEPSVQELLAQDASPHWGARAWEEVDLNAGDTVKRLVPDNEPAEDAGAYAARFALPGAGLQRGSRGSSKGKGGTGDAKVQTKDIFSRPLPTPPKPGVPSPGGDPVKAAECIERVDQGVQVGIASEAMVETHDTGVQTNSSSVDAATAEKLQEAEALAELFRQRLAEVEKKLEVMERKDAELAQINHTSQAVETDQAIAPEETTTPAATSAALRFEGDNLILNKELSRDRNTGESIASPTSESIPHRPCPSSLKRDWRELPANGEWDPLEKGLGSYVLMVGVGVCAVVLSTLLKRMAGKKS